MTVIYLISQKKKKGLRLLQMINTQRDLPFLGKEGNNDFSAGEWRRIAEQMSQVYGTSLKGLPSFPSNAREKGRGAVPLSTKEGR